MQRVKADTAPAPLPLIGEDICRDTSFLPTYFISYSSSSSEHVHYHTYIRTYIGRGGERVTDIQMIIKPMKRANHQFAIRVKKILCYDM